jgi:hypothetical protein
MLCAGKKQQWQLHSSTAAQQHSSTTAQQQKGNRSNSRANDSGSGLVSW